MIEKDHSFLVLNIVRLCVSLKIIFFRPMILLLDLMVEICFLNDLENFIVTQVMTRIWHNVRPRKVGTFIWPTLIGVSPVGTWLQCMGILPTCKVCTKEAPESPQHCLLECPSPNRLGRHSITSSKNGEHPMTSSFPDLSSCWVKLSLREKMNPWDPRVPCRRLLLHQTIIYILLSFILYFLWS